MDVVLCGAVVVVGGAVVLLRRLRVACVAHHEKCTLYLP